MKLSMDRKVLASALKTASEIFPAKAQHAILWLSPRGGGCVATSYDGDMRIDEIIECQISEPGPPAGLPVGPTTEWVSHLPTDAGAVDVVMNAHAAEITCGGNRVRLSTAGSAYAPKEPDQKYDTITTVESSTIKKVIDFSAGPERDEMAGVYFGVLNDTPVAFTSSGIVYCHIDLPSPTTEAFIPRIVADIAVALRGSVEIAQSPRGIRLGCGNRYVYGPQSATRRIEWSRIVSGLKFPAKVRVLSEDLEAAVRACHCLRGWDKYIPIAFDISQGSLVLSASSAVGTTATRVAGALKGQGELKQIPSEQLLRFFQHNTDETTLLEFGETRMPLRLKSTADKMMVGIVPMCRPQTTQ